MNQTSFAHQVRVSTFEGRQGVAGLDVPTHSGLAAFVLVLFPTSADPRWRVLSFFWLAAAELAKVSPDIRERYLAWQRDDYLVVCPDEVPFISFVLRQIESLCCGLALEGIAVDRWREKQFLNAAEWHEHQFPDFRGVSIGSRGLDSALKVIETASIGDRLVVEDNPVMTWCISSIELAVGPISRRRRIGQTVGTSIVGVVTLLMALGLALDLKPEGCELGSGGSL